MFSTENFDRKFQQKIFNGKFSVSTVTSQSTISQSTSQSVDNQSTSQSTSQSTISQATSLSVDNHISCPSGQGDSVRRVAAVPALSPSSTLCQSVRRGLFVGRRHVIASWSQCVFTSLRQSFLDRQQQFCPSGKSGLIPDTAAAASTSRRVGRRSVRSSRLSSLSSCFMTCRPGWHFLHTSTNKIAIEN